MNHVIEPKNPVDTQPIYILETSYGILIQNRTIFTNLALNIYFLPKIKNSSLLAASWGPEFNYILDACKSPQYWGGFYTSAERQLPTLALLIANTVSGDGSAIRVFKMPDPDDKVEKWIVGKQIESSYRLVAQLNQLMSFPPDKYPREYQEMVIANQKLVTEHQNLLKQSQSRVDKLKGAYTALTTAPTVPMPSPAVFGVSVMPAPKSSVSDSTMNQAADVLENVVNAGQVFSGNAGDVAANGIIGELINKFADDAKAPFDNTSSGAQKVNRVMPIYLSIFIPFALITILSNSAKPLGMGIALIGLYFIVSAKAILAPGINLAYFVGMKARIVGIIYLLLGMMILLAGSS